MWAPRVSMSTYAWARLEPRALQVMPPWLAYRGPLSATHPHARNSTYHG